MKPIPEIMGWERPPSEWGYKHGEHWVHPTRGICVHAHSGWTVDDMLAWLRAELLPMEIEVYPDGFLPRDGWDVWVNRVPDYEGNTEHYNGFGQTLHDALEAAVRAVDKANA